VIFAIVVLMVGIVLMELHVRNLTIHPWGKARCVCLYATRVARQEKLLAARDNPDEKLRIVPEALICWSQILLIFFPHKVMLVFEGSAVADSGWTLPGRHLANSW
jgi:hypothetical protein